MIEIVLLLNFIALIGIGFELNDIKRILKGDAETEDDE